MTNSKKMNDLEYIWLSNLDISNKNKFDLIKKFESIENIYNCSLDDLLDFQIKENIAYQVLNKDIKEKSKRDLEYINKNGIKIISYDNEKYPEKFKCLNDKPTCIYVKGNIDILNQESIGIVGSRFALKESLEISKLLAYAFANQGTHVVSGLAIGIDKYAHLGALSGNGKRKNYWNNC